MDNTGLERIPLPQFSTYLLYTGVSFIGSLVRLLYAFWLNDAGIRLPQADVTTFLSNLLHLSLDDAWFFWSSINLALCILILLGRSIQHIVFGELRASEHTNFRENILNFIFYKVVFIYGVLNVDALYEFLLWAGWFSTIGFLILLTDLINDRFQFIVHSPQTVPLQTGMFSFLLFILLACNFLTAISATIGSLYSVHLMCFMFAEVLQLIVKTIHIIAWYVLHLYFDSVAQNVQHTPQGAYHETVYAYYIELVFSTLIDVIDLVHNFHLLFWNCIRINMSSLIIGLHIQHLYYKLSTRCKHHKRYRELIRLLDPYISQAHEPEHDCLICWDALVTCVKLPCGHLFHLGCIHTWLVRSTQCPTCRVPLDAQLNKYPEDHHISTNSQQSTTTSSTNRVAMEETIPRTLHEPRTTSPSTSSSTHLEYGATCDGVRLRQGEPDPPCSEPASLSSHSGTMSTMASINSLLFLSNNSDTTQLVTERSLPSNYFNALEAELNNYSQSISTTQWLSSSAANLQYSSDTDSSLSSLVDKPIDNSDVQSSTCGSETVCDHIVESGTAF